MLCWLACFLIFSCEKPRVPSGPWTSRSGSPTVPAPLPNLTLNLIHNLGLVNYFPALNGSPSHLFFPCALPNLSHLCSCYFYPMPLPHTHTPPPAFPFTHLKLHFPPYRDALSRSCLRRGFLTLYQARLFLGSLRGF